MRKLIANESLLVRATSLRGNKQILFGWRSWWRQSSAKLRVESSARYPSPFD